MPTADLKWTEHNQVDIPKFLDLKAQRPLFCFVFKPTPKIAQKGPTK